MDGSRNQEHAKDLFSAGRRSAISTSELGLYSDHSEQYSSNSYNITVRKSVIGIMAVVSVILIGIFLYDFASSASINSKVSQETKHIYILQNSLRKAPNATRKSSSATPHPTLYVVNTSQVPGFEDRTDSNQTAEYKEEEDGAVEKSDAEVRSQRMAVDEPESKTLNLQNFKIRDRILDRQPDEDESAYQDKQMVDNHAMIYRVSRLKIPEPDEVEIEPAEEENVKATPFRFELRGPHPASFKHSKYPQLAQYRYPYNTRSIQDILKYLTNDPEGLNRGIRFTGFYVSPKKYDMSQTDIGEVAMNSDKSEEQISPYAVSLNADPLYQYKPKHPSDVNLLAPSNFRFSPMGINRYNPYYDPYYQRPSANKQIPYQENQYDNTGYGMTSYGKKRKPKPFSIMLDIYPITESEQTKKSSKVKPQVLVDEIDQRRPPIPFYPRYAKNYGAPAPIAPMPMQHATAEEEEKHQMILHLNVYPKKKNKPPRNEVMERSETITSGEKQELIDRLIVPFQEITKHLTAHVATEEAKLNNNEDIIDMSKVRNGFSETDKIELIDRSKNKDVKLLAERVISTTEPYKCKNCEILTTMIEVTTAPVTSSSMTVASSTKQSTYASKDPLLLKDIDTVEGFQKFADSLIAID